MRGWNACLLCVRGREERREHPLAGRMGAIRYRAPAEPRTSRCWRMGAWMISNAFRRQVYMCQYGGIDGYFAPHQ